MRNPDTAISVRGLSKCYTIGHESGNTHSTLAEALLSRVRRPFARVQTETFWALKDIDFDIAKGDVVGIIGRNGAGKSTLLKILSRITEPTSGEVRLYGRVGSLLEVGTGFHPELTGRENVYLNGQILGMRKKEIDTQFDAIVDFAGVEKFLDTPVKRYSSGMYVRLAFAVAAHLDSEILLVDEVLAVGDLEFQKKCLGKIKDVATSGRTVLFVTHHMQSVKTLCTRGIYLQAGEVRYVGNVDHAIQHYVSAGQERKGLSETRRRGSGAVRFASIATDKGVYEPQDDLVLRAEIESNTEAFGTYAVSVDLRNHYGLPVLHLDSRLLNLEYSLAEDRSIELRIKRPRLAHGEYTLNAYLFSATEGFDVCEPATTFHVAPILPYPGARGDCVGNALVYPDFSIETQMTSRESSKQLAAR